MPAFTTFQELQKNRPLNILIIKQQLENFNKFTISITSMICTIPFFLSLLKLDKLRDKSQLVIHSYVKANKLLIAIFLLFAKYQVLFLSELPKL